MRFGDNGRERNRVLYRGRLFCKNGNKKARLRDSRGFGLLFYWLYSRLLILQNNVKKLFLKFYFIAF